jgi:hypothetical protein
MPRSGTCRRREVALVERATTNAPLSNATNAPCPWIKPSAWMGSRSQFSIVDCMELPYGLAWSRNGSGGAIATHVARQWRGTVKWTLLFTRSSRMNLDVRLCVSTPISNLCYGRFRSFASLEQSAQRAAAFECMYAGPEASAFERTTIICRDGSKVRWWPNGRYFSSFSSLEFTNKSCVGKSPWTFAAK